jgi:hypothetical protein
MRIVTVTENHVGKTFVRVKDHRRRVIATARPELAVGGGQV